MDASKSADVSTGGCTTHHQACECREQQIATLNKAALDCAIELDWIKKECGLDEEKCEELTSILMRVYAASAALYPSFEDDIEQARRLVGQYNEALQ
jgi:hypothetical protein